MTFNYTSCTDIQCERKYCTTEVVLMRQLRMEKSSVCDIFEIHRTHFTASAHKRHSVSELRLQL